VQSSLEVMTRLDRFSGLGLAIALFTAASGLCSEPVVFTEYVIDGNSNGHSSLWVGDLDNDNRKEILGVVILDNTIVYWKQEDGDPGSWTKHTVESWFRGPRSVDAADLDSDGDLDVIGAAWEGDEVAWWSNEGGSPIDWTKHGIRAGYSLAHEVIASDVDLDGDQDVLGASSGLGRISLWYNDGGRVPQWTEQTVAGNFFQAKSVAAGDFDGDGRVDLVGAALEMDGGKVLWWRNRGGHPIHWEGHNVDLDFIGAHRVQAVDLDRDGDLDVVGAGFTGHVVAWWRNEGGEPITWTKQIISQDVRSACVAVAADLDGDGDLDVAATSMGANEILWWRNDGGEPITWIEDRAAYLTRVWPLVVADLDGDGRNDLIAASSHYDGYQVKWFRNTEPSAGVRFPAGRVRPGP